MDTEQNLVPQADGSTDTISRQKALKRLGVAAGIAWAAPLFVTTSTAAAHTGDLTCLDKSIAKQNKPACQGCPACATTCGPQNNCCCYIDTKGCCYCGEQVHCNQIQSYVCKSNSTCPSGWRCVYTCCGEAFKRCVPPCGHGPILAPPGSGPTSGG